MHSQPVVKVIEAHSERERDVCVVDGQLTYLIVVVQTTGPDLRPIQSLGVGVVLTGPDVREEGATTSYVHLVSE